MGSSLTTADDLMAALQATVDPEATETILGSESGGEPVMGVRMGPLFAFAKQATNLPPKELEQLFSNPIYEARLAAFCILDFRARRRLTDDERLALAHVYLDHHDAITSWGMVDRAAPRVIGWPIQIGVLDATILEDLARSPDPLRRRSALTAPLWFVKNGTDDYVKLGLAIADMLAGDRHPRVASAVKIYRKHAARRLS